MTTLPKAITFDCYGTLIDWESEIQHFFAERLEAKHSGHVDPHMLQRAWETIQFHALQENYRPYRQVLRDTMKLAFEQQFHIPDEEADGEAFAGSMGNWKPFPDTRDAILALQKLTRVVLTTV